MAFGISASAVAQSPTPPVDSGSAKEIIAEAQQNHAVEGTLTLSASLATKKLILKQGDSVVASYDVAVGSDGHPTPTGSFKIRKIVWNPRWVPPDAPWARGKTAKEPGHPANPMKVVKIFFQEPDYYIHGTGDIESLGTAASHGCLRMDPDEAAQVAKWVMIHGGQPREENWFKRVLHFRRQEQVVYLNNPVSLTITS
jgi:lipoprotein-anchoring transpeptidase ErfK/SrfK